jgi:hypothetical protein
MSTKNPDITIEKFNDTMIAINVPTYYKTFMENLGCEHTLKNDIWVIHPDVLPEVEKFLKTCNVNSGFLGYVKKEWTEKVKLKRKINQILSLTKRTCRSTYPTEDVSDMDVFEKLDIIIEILEESL